MIRPEEDGHTHINVYSKGRTTLGRALSNFARRPFEHPRHGHFESIEGLWYWLSVRDDRLRSAYGFDAKKLGRSLRAADWRADATFQRDVAEGIWAKIDAHDDIRVALQQSTLPLLHYYVFGGIVKDETARCRWMLDIIEEKRALRV